MRGHASNLDAACVTLIVALLLALPALSVAQSTAVLRTPWGDPDLQGIWDQTTGTPLERAPDVADREFLSEEEAARRALAVPGTTGHNGETAHATQSTGPP